MFCSVISVIWPLWDVAFHKNTCKIAFPYYNMALCNPYVKATLMKDMDTEMMTDKPAINTLKKTFTAMLSRIGNSRMLGGTGDTSSDNISVNSR